VGAFRLVVRGDQRFRSCMRAAPSPLLTFSVSLPEWLPAELVELPATFTTPERRVGLVLDLARKNFEHDSGGPFAAAVFEEPAGTLVAVGVNRVVASACSSAHAEVVALSLAQAALGGFDLGGPGVAEHELVVSWRPCAMCFGAVLWSGVRSLLVAGTGPELAAITGFDEGPLPADWRGELSRRGVKFREGVLREQACAIFRDFAARGGFVYNGRRGDPRP
jgi:tRNA(Arg) A34 adenosine deaminase TadA